MPQFVETTIAHGSIKKGRRRCLLRFVSQLPLFPQSLENIPHNILRLILVIQESFRVQL